MSSAGLPPSFLGAFALIFVGVGSIAAGADLVGVALAHGLAIAVMASAVGHISGGHFNPAVTFGFLVTRRIEPVVAVAYGVAQLAGATVAAIMLRAVFSGVGGGSGVLLEAVLTFFLVWVIFATAADPRGAFKSIAGLAIGLTITRGAPPHVAGVALRSCRAG